jgi:diguanylate cyclase (GGDEF)-like protein/PAS domain S-box-containing protein
VVKKDKPFKKETIGSAVDITGHKRAEDEANRQQAFLRQVIDSSPNLIFVKDRDDRYLLANNAMANAYGTTPAYMQGKTDLELGVPAEEFAKYRKDDIEVLQSGKEKIIPEESLTWQSGEVHYYHTTKRPLLDEKGEFNSLLAVSVDITNRKKAEDNLRASEERYNALFDRSLDLVYVRDFKGNFIDANPAALDLLGYLREDIPTLNIVSLLSPEQYPKTLQTLKELSETGRQKEPTEYKLKCKDGGRVDVETQESVIYRDGKSYAVQGVGRNITERKQAEERSLIRRNLAIDLSAVITLEKALSFFLEAAIRISGMDSGAVYLIDERTGELKLSFHQDLSQELVNKYSKFASDSANTRLVMRGQPLYLRREEFTTPFDGQFSAQDFSVIAMIPIGREDKAIGCLIMTSQGLNEVPSSARNSVETIATEIASTIDRIKVREAMERSEERYRNILDNMQDSYIELDLAGNFTFINEATCRNLGYTMQELIGANFGVIAPGQDDIKAIFKVYNEVYRTGEPHTGFAFKIIRKDGSTGYAETSISLIKNEQGSNIGFRSVGRDVTERKQMEQKLEEMATHDYLTGLPNRVLLLDRFTIAAALAHRNKARLAVMSLDLDRFKSINDNLGHDAGDQVLKAVGVRLTGLIRASDTLARIGGDEFILVMLETNHVGDAATIAQKILDSFTEPLSIDGHELHLTTSIGIAVYPKDAQDMETLTKKSDAAMYYCKGHGRNQFKFFGDGDVPVSEDRKNTA